MAAEEAAAAQSMPARLDARTPAPELDAAARSAAAALDAAWRPPAHLAGAECDAGWVLGWRSWYGPVCAGDHDRVRQAIRFHGGCTAPDGTPLPLVRFDGRGEATGADVCPAFVDQVRHYYAWSGDRETVREVWPALRACLERERRESAAGDGLFTNRANTWAAAGHDYGGGACTAATAMMAAAFRFAADAAALAGDDPTPYRQQADLARSALRQSLWMPRAGHFAEYRDSDGVLHPAASASSAILPVLHGLTEPVESLRSIAYVAGRLLSPDGLVLANDWLPAAGVDHAPAAGETLLAALACALAGEWGLAWRMVSAVCPFVAESTGTAGLFARCLVEGLFGLAPDVPRAQVTWSPRFPPAWERAELHTAGCSLSYERRGTHERYSLEAPADLSAILRVPLRFDRLKSVTLNGAPASYRGEAGLDRQEISVRAPAGRRAVLEITYSNRTRYRVAGPEWVLAGETVGLQTTAGTFAGVEDPERALQNARADGARLSARVRTPGDAAFFARLKLPHAEVLHPVRLEVRPAYELLGSALAFEEVRPALAVTLRCNRPERIALPVEILYAGRTYRAKLAKAPRGAASAPPAPETFRFPVESPEWLSPGRERVRVTIRALSGPVVLEGETLCWPLFESWPAGRAAFAERCFPIPLEANAPLGDLAPPHPAGNPDWTDLWHRCAFPAAPALPLPVAPGEHPRADADVPFAPPAGPGEIRLLTRGQALELPVGERVGKVYLLLASRTDGLQTGLPLARVTIEYEEGRQEQILLRAPEDVDHVLQHTAAHAWPQPLPGLPLPGAHADLLDLLPAGREPVACLRIECVARDAVLGILGLTAVRRRL